MFRTRAIRVSPDAVRPAPTAFCTRVSRPSPVSVWTRPSTTRSAAGLPETCGPLAMPLHVDEGTARAELAGRGVDRCGIGGLQGSHAPRDEAEKNGEQDQPGAAARPSPGYPTGRR